METDEESFLASLSKELTARSNRIRYLIGDSHWASDGYHNENVVRDFLNRYSPKAINVSHGFIRSIQPKVKPIISPEVDILLSDVLHHVPLLSEGGLQVISPDAVRAYFEVKSTFSRQNLRNALRHIKEVQSVFLTNEKRRKVWRCIFFNYHGSHKSPQKAIIEEIKKISQENGLRDPYLPNCIVINGASITFISPIDESTRVRYFEIGEFSLACALADIISALRNDDMAFPNTDLQQLILQLDAPLPTKWTI
ncbi:MAG: DUF6602 domain-containing protein [Candidatus Thiodiazotropha sp.]